MFSLHALVGGAPGCALPKKRAQWSRGAVGNEQIFACGVCYLDSYRGGGLRANVPVQRSALCRSSGA